MNIFTRFSIILALGYGNIYCHVVDVHLPSAEENQMMEDAQQDRENQDANDILNNPDCTPEEIDAANNTLVENGRLV